jgi:LuxR family maltose regulon positive regulatory protein
VWERNEVEVATSLLATKFNIPPIRPQLVTRPRLIERLQEALNYNLILVSAPAGFGKTTLLSEWVHKNQPKIYTTWISLDEGDNDPVRFWDYFISALQVVQPGCGENILPLLHSPQPMSTESILTTLINDLNLIQSDFVLLLDDYHLIKAEAIHTGVTFLLDHMLPRMHLIIATRVEPALPLPRFRGRGTMLEIGADDLRFTPEEATVLLRGLQPPELTADDVDALCERTEGWAVGLKMAALSMRGQKDVPGFIATFTGSQRYVMDYLMEEVLQKQPPEVRDFLMKTSVLERLATPLCDSITGRSDSQDMLLKLESGFGGFLIPLDTVRQWYRYHHLIAELLLHQLESTRSAEEVRQLHQRAIQWYEYHDYPDDAIRHSLKIRDWEGATKLVEKAADGLIKRGEWNTLSAWFQAVPEEVLRTHPVAYAQYANVLTTLGRLEAAEAVLVYLEAIPNLEESLQGQLTFFRMSAAYFRGDIRQTVELAERAVEQLGEENGAMCARALHLMGMFDIMAGRYGEGQSREDEAVRTARRAGESWVAATAAGNLSNIPLFQGRLRQAVTAARSAGAREPLACALYERNELEEAARSAQLGIKKSELSGYAESEIGPHYSLAQVLMANGDVAGAEAEMAKGDETSRGQNISPVFRAIHAANRVIFTIQCGDLAAAVDWGNQLSELPFDALFYLQHVPARLLIARGENTAAADQLRGLYERTVQAEAQGLAIRIRVYQALAAETQDEAVGFLADALRMGEPEGFIRTFVDEGKLLKLLLKKALVQEITPGYTRKLLDIIEVEERGFKTADNKAILIPETPEFLSQRELEVLRLIAEGLTNKQITRKLSVSQNTLKTHIRHVFEKLDAKNRFQAVKRGKELNLI